MMIENRKLYSGHSYSGALLQACVDGYQQGRKDTIDTIVDTYNSNPDIDAFTLIRNLLNENSNE